MIRAAIFVTACGFGFAPAFASDVVGTFSVTEPVTQRESIQFVISTEDAVLTAGCVTRGDGDVFISVKPKRFKHEPVENILNPSQHRFAGQERLERGQWLVSQRHRPSELRFDDMVVGGTARKARFFQEMGTRSALYLRYWTGTQNHTLTFEYWDAETDLRKMLHACNPKGVLKSLALAKSHLATPLLPSEADIPTLAH